MAEQRAARERILVVDVQIANLRKKLGDDPNQPRYLITVRGVGYRMGKG